MKTKTIEKLEAENKAYHETVVMIREIACKNQEALPSEIIGSVREAVDTVEKLQAAIHEIRSHIFSKPGMKMLIDITARALEPVEYPT